MKEKTDAKIKRGGRGKIRSSKIRKTRKEKELVSIKEEEKKKDKNRKRNKRKSRKIRKRRKGREAALKIEERSQIRGTRGRQREKQE